MWARKAPWAQQWSLTRNFKIFKYQMQEIAMYLFHLIPAWANPFVIEPDNHLDGSLHVSFAQQIDGHIVFQTLAQAASGEQNTCVCVWKTVNIDGHSTKSGSLIPEQPGMIHDIVCVCAYMYVT